jgi:CspA family cold shock protein
MYVRSEYRLLRGVAFMPQGIVKKLVADRGFGFIKGDRGEIFFHHSVVADHGFEQLQEGQSVEYQVAKEPGPKGPRASEVKPL